MPVRLLLAVQAVLFWTCREKTFIAARISSHWPNTKCVHISKLEEYER